jgi:hypothetical protein
MGVPALVTPLAPDGEQKAPGWTIWTSVVVVVGGAVVVVVGATVVVVGAAFVVVGAAVVVVTAR